MALILRPQGYDAPLTDQLAGLGRFRRNVAAAAAGFALVGVVAAAALVTCGLDAWLRLPPLGRGIALVLTLTAAGVLGRRLAAARRLPTDPLAVALELEDRDPRLNDALASAVSFLETHPVGTSERLRAAAVRRAEKAAARSRELDRLAPVGRCWRAFWLFTVVAVTALPLALWDPPRTTTALVRFADPFGHHPWPAKTRIELLAPKPTLTRLPKGEPLDLRFAVRGVIPDRAAVAFRSADGVEFEEVYPLAAGNDPKEPAAAFVSARIDADRLPRDFSFQVRANDADTGWQDVRVIPPPRLVPRNGRASPQVHVVPPAYTRLRPADLPDGTGVVEVPLGTRIELRAATDVPLARAGLVYLGDRTAVDRTAGLAALGHFDPLSAAGMRLLADGVGADIPVRVESDGRTLSAAFSPSLSGTYALKMTDPTGLTGSRLLELRLTPDPPPTVTLHQPAADRDPSLLNPRAVIAVRLSAEDRVYALRRVFLEYQVGRDGPVRVIPIQDAGYTDMSLAALAGAAATVVRPRPVTANTPGFPLPVSAFLRDDGTPVREGDVVVLRAAADDWDDVAPLKGPGRSKPFEIRVLSQEAIDTHLQKELAAMRPEFVRLRDQQRAAALREGEPAPGPDGALAPKDREGLLTAEHAQRQITGRVADPDAGLLAKAALLRDTAAANGLPETPNGARKRAERVAELLEGMAARDLKAVETLLADARQLGTQAARPPAAEPSPGLAARLAAAAREQHADRKREEVAGRLTQARRHQRAVEGGFNELLDLLSEWGGAAEVRGEARVTRDEANQHAAEAAALPERVPAGKTRGELTPGQTAELDRAAGPFDQLAERAGLLLTRAGRIAAEKDKQAAAARAAAAAKEKEAERLRKKAAEQEPGSVAEQENRGRAEVLAAEAEELRRAAARAAAEADALRTGLAAAGGQAIPDELRRAADQARSNRPGEAVAAARAAADRLDRLARTLETPDESVPELAKKRKAADDVLRGLAEAQAALNKKTEAAGRLAPAARAEELKKLAREQENLLDQAREAARRLSRENAEDAARLARQAADKMEAARDALEQGKTPAGAGDEAARKMEQARRQLQREEQEAARTLSADKRAKLAQQVLALLVRQKAAMTTAGGIQEAVIRSKAWERDALTKYGDLEDAERELATAARTLAAREFAELPVFARLLTDAGAALDRAGDRVRDRLKDALDPEPGVAFDPELEKANGDTVGRPMALAAGRLQMLLDALHDASNLAKKDPPPVRPEQPMPPPVPMAEPPKKDTNRDVVPPLAQLKALRALKQDVVGRTAEFDRRHPDRSKLTPPERAELADLEAAEREIADLFGQIAPLFKPQPKTPAPETP